MASINSMESTKFTHGELFAGLGGFAQAAHRSGFETLWANEMASGPSNFYKSNFPNVEHLCCPLDKAVSRITQIPVDVISAGFPCQPFSYAGPRKMQLDARSEPIFFLDNILNGLKECKPKFIILENVRGFYSKDNPVLPALENLLRHHGYFIPMNGMFLASLNEMSKIPQARVRFVALACRVDLYPAFRFSKKYFPIQESNYAFEHFVDFDRDYDAHQIAEDNKYAKLLREKIEEKRALGENPQNFMFQIRKTYARVLNKGVCPTLTANMGSGGHNVPFIVTNTDRIRRLTPHECANLQGFNPDYDFGELKTWSPVYKAIGNSVAVPMFEPIYRELFEYLNTYVEMNQRQIA